MSTMHLRNILLYLVPGMILSLSVISGRPGDERDGSCSYSFQVWEPGKDALKKLRELDIKCEDVSVRAGKSMQELRNGLQKDLLTALNVTHRLEKDILEHKVEAVQILKGQAGLQVTLDKIKTENADTKRELKGLKSVTDKLRRYKSDTKTENREIRKEISQVNKVSTHLKNNIGNLKAEWLLIKRDVQDIRSENVQLKFGQNGLKTDAGKLEKMIFDVQKDTLQLKQEQSDIKSDSIQLKKKLDDVRSENAEMKDSQGDTRMFSIQVQKQVFDMRDENNVLEKQLEILKQNNMQMRREMTILKKVAEDLSDGRVMDKNFVWPSLPPLPIWPSMPLHNDQNNVIDASGLKTGRPRPNQTILIASPQDCNDHYLNGYITSGVYKIQPLGVAVPDNAYCEMFNKTGWTVIQRRIDGSLKFDRSWQDYKFGFGNSYGEFWLGNERIHFLTQQRNYILRIDIWDWEGRYYYAEYDTFRVDSEIHKYRLTINNYHGNAGDSFSYHDNTAFSTEDSDNDLHRRNCAADNKSGWWFHSCLSSNLNGEYHSGWYTQRKKSQHPDGIVWYTLKESEFYSLKKVEMKIKPKEP